MNEARIDKWLWAARIFKTRSMAAAACKKGQISMKGATETFTYRQTRRCH